MYRFATIVFLFLLSAGTARAKDFTATETLVGFLQKIDMAVFVPDAAECPIAKKKKEGDYSLPDIEILQTGTWPIPCRSVTRCVALKRATEMEAGQDSETDTTPDKR